MQNFNRKAISNQILLLPISAFIAYVAISLRMYNEVSYGALDDAFPIGFAVMVTVLLYAVLTLAFRTKIHLVIRDTLRVFKPNGESGSHSGFYILCCVTIFYLFYSLFLKVPYDFPDHTDVAMSFDWRSLKVTLLSNSYPLWHLSVNLISKCAHIPAVYAAALSSAGFLTAEYVIMRNIARSYLNDISDEKQRAVDIFVFAFMFMQPFYIPWYNSNQILGQGTPNTWHNPTIIACYPFALICVYLFLDLVKRYRENQPYGLPDFIRFGFYLFVSTTAKPSFIQVFIPAVAILFVIMLIESKAKSFYFEFKFVISCIPAGLWCILVFLLQFVPNETNRENGLAISQMFELWSYFAPSVIVSILIASAFPLAWMLFYNRKSTNKNILFVLLMFICGILEYAFLVETGSRKMSGNLSWGYYSALNLLYIFSYIPFIDRFFKERNRKTTILLTILALNFLFGMRYYVYLYGQPGYL